MQTVKIKLNSIEDIKSFAAVLSSYDSDFDIVSGKYIIDAKSIMAYFCLNLKEPLTMRIHSDEKLNSILESIDSYLVKE